MNEPQQSKTMTSTNTEKAPYKVLVIYHSTDMDGRLSGVIAKHFRQRPWLQVDMLGWNYGDPIPDTSSYDGVHLLDLSISPEFLEQNSQKLVWIDHHKTALDLKFAQSYRGLRIDGVAACRLVWQYYAMDKFGHPFSKEDFTERRVSEPEIVRMVGERDVWDRREGDRLEWLNSALLLRSMEELEEILFKTEDPDALLDNLIYEGRLLQRSRDYWSGVASASKMHAIQFHGLTFAVMNYEGNSLSFKEDIVEKLGAEALMLWTYTGKDVVVSLYHAKGHEEIDLSKIALQWGGGGHRGACGFRCGLHTMTSILTGTDYRTMPISG